MKVLIDTNIVIDVLTLWKPFKEHIEKQLPLAHCKEFRYLSSNKKVATVTAGGKVKANLTHVVLKKVWYNV